MKRLSFILALLLALAAELPAAFTEFYVQSTGSNLNAGSTTAAAALFTHTNGNWDSTTGIFIATGGADLSQVAVGDFASVYNDGATVAVFVGRITAVVDATDTITVSTTAKSGTAPTTSTTARSIKVGGAWLGPNAGESLPFGFIAAAMTNAAGDRYRVNGKGTNNITAAMTHSIAGPGRFQGYTTTPGDAGRWIIDGGTSGASFVLLTASAADCAYADMTFQNNGATGTATGLDMNAGTRSRAFRVAVNSVRGAGLRLGAGGIVEECEFYLCNQSNTAAVGAIRILSAGATIVRSFIHDNSGSNNNGIVLETGATATIIIDSVIESNGLHGLNCSGASHAAHIINTDFYNNGGSGIFLGTGTGPQSYTIVNCNFVKNGVRGITDGGTSVKHGVVQSCGFGSGTQANVSGDVSANSATNLIDNLTATHVTYAADVTPWVDPANGDFDINLAAAKGTGRGTFLQTAPSYTGTLAFPDIGAAQSLATSTINGSGSL